MIIHLLNTFKLEIDIKSFKVFGENTWRGCLISDGENKANKRDYQERKGIWTIVTQL